MGNICQSDQGTQNDAESIVVPNKKNSRGLLGEEFSLRWMEELMVMARDSKSRIYFKDK